MGQPRIVEVDYYTFRAKLKAAAASGSRIEKTDGNRWKEYVKARKVDLYSIQAWVKVRFMGEEIKLAIIDGGGDWDGVYAWSEEDERVARWESGEDPGDSATSQDAVDTVTGQDAGEAVPSPGTDDSVTGQDAGDSAASPDAEDSVAGHDPEQSLT